jgi:hypothetical protein
MTEETINNEQDVKATKTSKATKTVETVAAPTACTVISRSAGSIHIEYEGHTIVLSPGQRQKFLDASKLKYRNQDAKNLRIVTH